MATWKPSLGNLVFRLVFLSPNDYASEFELGTINNYTLPHCKWPAAARTGTFL